MSTCEKISPSRPEYRFSKICGESEAFDHVRDYFNSEIAMLYGDQTKALNKISVGSDRECELLISMQDEEELGIIVYKNNPTDEFADLGFTRSFEIKTLFVINAQKNSGKKIASKLLRRIATKAVEKEACSIFVTVSSAKPESLAFFLSHGFKVCKISKDLYVEGLDEYFLFNPSPQKLLSTITFELLAKHRINTTPISKIFPEELFLTTIEEKILSFYFSGNSTSRIIKNIQKELNIELDASFIESTLSNLSNHNLKWQSPKLSSEYVILFINPLFSTRNSQDLIGYVLVGVTPDGHRHLLGCCPAKKQPKNYWLKIFKQLKNQIVNQVNIICGPPNIKLPLSVNKLFADTKIIYSRALKQWSSTSFSPQPLAEELIKETAKLNEIPSKEQALQFASSA